MRVIGTLVRRWDGPVDVVTGDRDLFQLVRDPKVVVLYPRRGVSVLDRVDEAVAATALAEAGLGVLRGGGWDTFRETDLYTGTRNPASPSASRSRRSCC